MIDEHFIQTWIKHQESSTEDDDLHWTDDYLITLMMKKQTDELWHFVMKTYRRDLSQKVESILAAGALEDILAIHGEAYISRVELLAANDARFKHLLGGVWKNAMSDQVWARLCAAKGEVW